MRGGVAVLWVLGTQCVVHIVSVCAAEVLVLPGGCACHSGTPEVEAGG